MDPLLSTFLPGEGRRRRRGGKGFVTEGCSTTPELDRYRGRLSFLGPWNWRRKSIERMPSSPPLSSLLESLQPSRKTGTTVFTPVLDVIRLRIRVSPVIVSYPLSPSKEEVSLSLSLFVQLIYAIRIVVVTIPKSFTYTIFPFPSYFFAPNATIAIERNPIFLLSLVEKEDGVEQMLRISQKNILPS